MSPAWPSIHKTHSSCMPGRTEAAFSRSDSIHSEFGLHRLTAGVLTRYDQRYREPYNGTSEQRSHIPQAAIGLCPLLVAPIESRQQTQLPIESWVNRRRGGTTSVLKVRAAIGQVRTHPENRRRRQQDRSGGEETRPSQVHKLPLCPGW